MQKQRLILIIGVVLGLVAVLLTKAYLDKQRVMLAEEAKKKVESIKTDLQTNQTAVLVAKQDIPRGAAIAPEALEVKIIPNQFVQPQAVTSIDRVGGMVTIAPVSAGEQVTLSKLSHPRQAGGGGLSGLTPAGKRAITIQVDNLASLVGMIKPGDYVDIITMMNMPVQNPQGQQVNQITVLPLFQNVLILAVGQDTGGVVMDEQGRYRKEERREASPFITIALSPQEANLMAFVQEQGKLRLVLRSPADSQVQPMQLASWDTLFQYLNLMPKEAQPAETKEEAPAPIGYVEVYRGLNKEIMPMTK